jgi:hypothetical protein
MLSKMPEKAWNWGGIFKCTDDHIFEKTLKIELSPIPQAYTLNWNYFNEIEWFITINRYLPWIWHSG